MVGEAGDSTGALAGCGRKAPDVVLVDIYLPQGGNGIDLASEISARYPGTKTLILTASKRADDVDRAMKAGAMGFLTQAALTGDRLAAAVRTVAGGGVVLDKEASQRLSPDGEIELSLLTARERQVLNLLGEGLSNKGIADRLTIDPKAVRTHLNNIYCKLNVKSRLQAAILARDSLARP